MTQTDLQDLQLQGVSDPRLALHAVSVLPAWLWSADGSQVLWANAVGARVFGTANGVVLAARSFGPADAHRRQIAQLARQLPENGATRLERLRGFGAPLGLLATCGCARIDLADGTRGILVTATTPGVRMMPLVERLQRLVDDNPAVLLAFTPEGIFAGASPAGRRLFDIGDLSETGMAQACQTALAHGRAELRLGPHHGLLYRVGSGDQTGLVAVITPQPAEAPDAPASDDVKSNAEIGNTPLTDTSTTDDPLSAARRHPLRFMWQMDADGQFALGSNEFIRLIGPQTAARCDHRPWQEIVATYGLDPDGQIGSAIDRRETWSGVAVNWPVDGGRRLAVELSGLPLFDDHRTFEGYRGFGVCRDLDALAQLGALRDADALGEISAVGARAAGMATTRWQSVSAPEIPPEPAAAEAQGNVVQFRSANEPRFPTLTPGENSAFHELARQLSARLENDARAGAADNLAPAAGQDTPPPAVEPIDEALPAAHDDLDSDQPEWLVPEDPPARGTSLRDRVLLDLMPTGILIYRLDRLLYANPAFLAQIGYRDLAALEQAGGLDALYVEPGVPSQSSTSHSGTPVTISAADGSSNAGLSAAAHLFAISWDGHAAHALIFAPPQTAPAPIAVAVPTVAPAFVAPPPEPAPPVVIAPPEAGQADAEDLGAILDVTTDGIVMFDADGVIHACNRSAQALFGYDGDDLIQRNIMELVAPDSTALVRDDLARVKDAGTTGLRDQGREVLSRGNHGDSMALSMTIGRTRADGPNFFALFRDLSQAHRGDSELLQARRLADRGANAKADMLARISHEIRAPLNAIIGFAEVMIGERFGALGNERYGEYMKDIRGSGERVIAIIDDLLELSRIETGKVELVFANQNLNELVEACVAMMQPQANRGRIIIRTSLSHVLPPVVADARALRQIAQNLIGASLSLANPGGQVIVSTALSDSGEVALRVRDTGHGLNDKEVAAALDSVRPAGPSDQASEHAGLSLSLTKALVEANRAQLHIKAAPQSGTLIEVVFSRG